MITGNNENTSGKQSENVHHSGCGHPNGGTVVAGLVVVRANEDPFIPMVSIGVIPYRCKPNLSIFRKKKFKPSESPQFTRFVYWSIQSTMFSGSPSAETCTEGNRGSCPGNCSRRRQSRKSWPADTPEGIPAQGSALFQNQRPESPSPTGEPRSTERQGAEEAEGDKSGDVDDNIKPTKGWKDPYTVRDAGDNIPARQDRRIRRFRHPG